MLNLWWSSSSVSFSLCNFVMGVAYSSHGCITLELYDECLHNHQKRIKKPAGLQWLWTIFIQPSHGIGWSPPVEMIESKWLALLSDAMRTSLPFVWFHLMGIIVLFTFFPFGLILEQSILPKGSTKDSPNLFSLQDSQRAGTFHLKLGMVGIFAA